jgi:hypothetical protein
MLTWHTICYCPARNPPEFNRCRRAIANQDTSFPEIMPKMTAAEAAVRVLESEGVDLVFGQPGAAILPLYQAMNERGTIQHNHGD